MIHIRSTTRLVFRAALGIAAASLSVLAPEHAFPTRAYAADSVSVVVGGAYARSGLHRLFFGNDYRDVWATPVRVEMLDMASEAGGLSPVRRVGGLQTKGLALKGADGRSYTFRGLEKEVSGLLDEELLGTVVEDIVRDQFSAQDPAGELVAGAITRKMGIRTQAWKLVRLPDDPVLGEFQKEFAGAVGFYGEYPTKPSGERTGTFGLTNIIGHQDIYSRLEAGTDRIDDRTLLKARILDLFLGDWDRHRRQWRWAQFPGSSLWIPVPEDRDQAFSRYQGVIMSLVRQREKRFQNFGEKYGDIEGLTWNGRDQDRRLLVELESDAYEETAGALREALTDEVLTDAVGTMPPEWRRLDGARLLKDLKGRREGLQKIAGRYYRHLARDVDVYLTHRSERVEAVRSANGVLEVTVRAADSTGALSEPTYHRVFRSRDTDEVRLYGLGGDDHVKVRGPAGGIRVRLIGGDGSDTLSAAGSGPAKLSDSSGNNAAIGAGWDAKPYVPPPAPPTSPWIPPRDWGSVRWGLPWFTYGPDLGPFFGYGMSIEGFGFRKHPYSHRHQIRAGYAAGKATGRGEYKGEFRRENRGSYYAAHAYGSGLEVLRYFGFGNETPDRKDSDFTKADVVEYLLHLSYWIPVGRKGLLSVGPVMKILETNETDSTLVNVERPYGAGKFSEVGAHGVLEYDSRNTQMFPRSGMHLEGRGTVYPEIGSVRKTFGELNGDASLYASAGTRLTLALRAGGKRVFGEFPYHEAATIGGGALGTVALDEPDYTVRGFHTQRFAGRSSVFTNAELRLRLARLTLILPGRWGILGFTDVGRVWQDGEDSKRWHNGVGGGIWASFYKDTATGNMGIAHSDEGDRFYFKGGFTF